MTEKHTFAVLLIVETADPRLSKEAIDEAMTSAGGVAAVRRAVLQHLPKDVQRLVALFPIEQARALMALHNAIGQDLLGEEMFVRPPPGYIPPTTE